MNAPADLQHKWRHEIGDFVTIAIEKTGTQYEIKDRGIDLYGDEYYTVEGYHLGVAFNFNIGYNCLRAVKKPSDNIRRDLITEWR